MNGTKQIDSNSFWKKEQLGFPAAPDDYVP
jgi:hypothetical protein